MPNKFDSLNPIIRSAFFDGSLKIQCPIIKLVQNNSNDPDILVTEGVIEIGLQFGVRANLRAAYNSSELKNPFGQAARESKTRSGEVYPEDQFFTLEATDTDGNVWRHSAVYVHVGIHLMWVTIQFATNFIEIHEEPEDATEFYHFLFADEVEFPPLISRFDPEKTDFDRLIKFPAQRLHGHIGEINVVFGQQILENQAECKEVLCYGSQSKSLPNMFGMHILDAIQFCTASQIMPIFAEISTNGRRTIRFERHSPWKRGFSVSPLAKIHHEGYFFELLKCYFQYSCKTEGPRQAPISRLIDKVFATFGMTYVAVALILTVTAESLIVNSSIGLMTTIDPKLKNFTKKLGNVLSTNPAFKELSEEYSAIVGSTDNKALSNRLNGLLSLLNAPRVVDAMWKLQEAGAITGEEIQSWKKLRHPSAHGGLDIQNQQMQELVDHMHHVTTMIYKIVFLSIGYRGYYSNVAIRGWSTEFFDAPTILKKLVL